MNLFYNIHFSDSSICINITTIRLLEWKDGKLIIHYGYGLCSSTVSMSWEDAKKLMEALASERTK